MSDKVPRGRGHGSRQVILDAALGLAAARGYVGTTMALVRRATQLPPSSLYWHFSNKDELLAEALEHGHARWRRGGRRWAPATDGEDLREALLANIRRTTSGTGDAKADWWRMGLILAIESGPTVGDGPRERFLRIRAQVRAEFEQWWSQATDLPSAHVKTIAQLTLAAHDGLFVHLQTDENADLDPLLRRLADGLVEIADHLRDAPEVSPAVAARPPMTYEIGSSSRERLIAAALEVAAESGYEGASISRICATAGMRASSVYWHFENKDDLFSAAVDDSYRAWHRAQSSWLPLGADVDRATDLPVMLTPLVASLRDLPPFLRIGLMLVLPKRAEPLPGRDRFVAVRHQTRDDLARWIRGALEVDPPDAEEMATLLVSIGDGLLFAEALDGTDMPPETTSDLLAHLIMARSFHAQSSH
ncbi:TetR family transcriptional regulator [Nocardioides albertanoniae]|uniref:TetR family transcriptional regulator n=1 Tax=Nocardioides albertanoniae TaxID=1175486 RepID=A0A543ACN0_9ACTN|nr:TetR/AcrR family transcriptional regulator [Nocardioides albertanoniae]TQL70341.1 TetR family transcriptional regulator [Nocardioides albertanoniae]